MWFGNRGGGVGTKGTKSKNSRNNSQASYGASGYGTGTGMSGQSDRRQKPSVKSKPSSSPVRSRAK